MVTTSQTAAPYAANLRRMTPPTVDLGLGRGTPPLTVDTGLAHLYVRNTDAGLDLSSVLLDDTAIVPGHLNPGPVPTLLGTTNLGLQ